MAWPITAGARGLQNNLCVRFSGERRLLACTRRQLADENPFRLAAETSRLAACAPQSRESVAEDGGSYNAAIVS